VINSPKNNTECVKNGVVESISEKKDGAIVKVNEFTNGCSE